jgi:hypothetical protein
MRNAGRLAFEQCAQPADAPLTATASKRGQQGLRIDQAEDEGLVHHFLQSRTDRDGGDIDQGLHRSRHRNPRTDRHVLGAEPAAPTHPHPTHLPV